MSPLETSGGARSARPGAPHPVGPDSLAPASAKSGAALPASGEVPGPPLPGGDDVIAQEKYRELVRRHFRQLPALFNTFTGLCAHMAWAPTWPCRWSVQELPARSRVCRKVVGTDGGLIKRCRKCAEHHLEETIRSGHSGHHFTCFLGVQNFWLPLILRGRMIGFAFVQALASPSRPTPHASAALSSPQASSLKPQAFEPVQMSHARFIESARLLKLICQHAETAALADLRKSDLTQAQHALTELQTVATRLRVELNGLVPAFSRTSPVLQTAKHPEQAVRAALSCIYAHYSKSVTLKQCADQVGLNAAYLSTLFSRSVGVPFKTYLTEVRMEKARELLSNSSKTISEVAFAVGYASENRFRIAFKQITGLSPSVWRETLRVQSNPADT